ncbi:MAG TPA: hypothetical protein VMF11_06115 [Candidatus Baltobacteraceae bacterium]|nr:hypothetical protein [Candidatus Baltobacteraceae bacterium]
MKTTWISALVAAVAAVAIAAPACADETPTCRGPLSPTETAFVQSVQRDITARFPHASDAIAAGYVRYTSPDDTGAISYANRKWVSDPTHPSQLWYDVNGNLMGADFSVPRPNGEPRPQLWGIDPCRWFEFNGHVHYVVRVPDTGKLLYDQYVWNSDFVAAGGSLSDPSAQTIVKIGRVPDASDVVTIFEFPTIWDLIVWVKPHQPNQLFW